MGPLPPYKRDHNRSNCRQPCRTRDIDWKWQQMYIAAVLAQPSDVELDEEEMAGVDLHDLTEDGRSGSDENIRETSTATSKTMESRMPEWLTLSDGSPLSCPKEETQQQTRSKHGPGQLHAHEYGVEEPNSYGTDRSHVEHMHFRTDVALHTTKRNWLRMWAPSKESTNVFTYPVKALECLQCSHLNIPERAQAMPALASMTRITREGTSRNQKMGFTAP